jgi:hypothetical protein
VQSSLPATDGIQTKVAARLLSIAAFAAMLIGLLALVQISISAGDQYRFFI